MQLSWFLDPSFLNKQASVMNGEHDGQLDNVYLAI